MYKRSARGLDHVCVLFGGAAVKYAALGSGRHTKFITDEPTPCRPYERVFAALGCVGGSDADGVSKLDFLGNNQRFCSSFGTSLSHARGDRKLFFELC